MSPKHPVVVIATKTTDQTQNARDYDDNYQERFHTFVSPFI